ncbi:glutamine synthetase-like protein [Apiospora arundinis]
MDLQALRTAIRTTPIVDNHAHPLLKNHKSTDKSFLSIATEAHGDALNDTWSSLAHIRAVKQLAGQLDCEPTWDAVEAAMKAKRSLQGQEASVRSDWYRRCMEGIETILLDNGLDSGDETHDYDWHNQFVTGECKRIVRIEALATDMIRRRVAKMTGETPRTILIAILDDFVREIERCIADPEVVGFKSIICYRGGLDLPSIHQMRMEEAQAELEGIVQAGADKFTRLQHRALNHVLLHATASRIAENGGDGSEQQPKKPIQFHTGLGDNDITLTKSSPSHLQTFIADYPTVPIVILHASYPWTREAGYLAAMYPNVYADFGEVFPFVSRQGQESILKQILELCPWSKILWSTDGHWFPETYLLAIMQMREVLETTLCDMVREGDLNEQQAIRLVQDVLFVNSKKLYNLQTETTLPSPESLANAKPSSKAGAGASASSSKGAAALTAIKRDAANTLRDPKNKWLRLVWVDYTASARCRVVPARKVLEALETGGSWTNTMAAFGLLQNDMPIPQITATGMYTLDVDCEFREPDGAETLLCPRTLLRNVIDNAKSTQGLEFLMGFEIEFVVLERNTEPGATEKYRTMQTDGHAWAVARVLAGMASILDEMADCLEEAGISIEQYHAESAPGQYEIVLSALPPLAACDSLVHARQIIESIAARHGYRVTLHPKPFKQLVGTASHVHLSVSSPGGDSPEVYEPFYAGILRHFPAIIAFTYSNPTSYERMVDSYWAGGRWIMWGRENKDHWEMKCLDGLANPYFAVAAILSAGVLGVAQGEPMVWKDCESDAAKLSPEQRLALGITDMFPASLDEALAALQADSALIAQLGSPEFVQRYVDVKKAEIGFLSQLGESERRQWIMERY